MLHSLLVPLDGSEFSERSLPLARGIARATGASMHLAQVHVPYEPDQLLSNTQFHFEGLNLTEYDDQHRKKEEEYLARVEDWLEKDGTDVDARLLEGRSIAHQLAEYADEVRSDMILMTTHGHSGLTRLWLGSVADAMIRETNLPLLVIHPDHPGGVPPEVESFEHVMIPLDGSELAEQVIPGAAEVAYATDARITLVHVLVPGPSLGFRMFPMMPRHLGPALDATEEYLEGIANGLRDEGLEVAIHAAHAEAAAPGLTGIAEEIGADLIALATHGYGGFKRALLGSVADKVLRASPLPLLVMRPPLPN